MAKWLCAGVMTLGALMGAAYAQEPAAGDRPQSAGKAAGCRHGRRLRPAELNHGGARGAQNPAVARQDRNRS